MDFYVPFFHYHRKNEFADVRSWRVIDPIESIRTGDILLFSASGLVSSGIKMFTKSSWNHIGMACWCELEYFDGSRSNDFFCFELGSQPFMDLMTRQVVDKAVRLVRLADIAYMYDMISFRRINIERNHDWSSRFEKFMHRWKGIHFISMLGLIKNYLFKEGCNADETTCAMLAADMMDHMGVIKLNFHPSQLNPDHFSAESKAFHPRTFKGPDIVIYRDSKLINARIIFMGIILLVILILIIILVYKLLRKYNKIGINNVRQTA